MHDPSDSGEAPIRRARPPVWRKPVRQPIGVPRRFAVCTALIILTMYGVLFAVMKTLGAPLSVFVLAAVFVTGVGSAQMLLFGGTQPRAASIIAGAVLYPLVWLTGYLVTYGFAEWTRLWTVHKVVLLVTHGGLSGAVLGYLTGFLTAGVFLAIDRIEKALDGPRPGP